MNIQAHEHGIAPTQSAQTAVKGSNPADGSATYTAAMSFSHSLSRLSHSDEVSQSPPILQIKVNSSFVTGWTERRLFFTRTISDSAGSALI